MNKLINDTMTNAADIMDRKITRNQEILDSLMSGEFPDPAVEAMINTLQKDNQELYAAVKLIRKGSQWI
jgi:hypothetical protein